jgi:hypothetical protein
MDSLVPGFTGGYLLGRRIKREDALAALAKKREEDDVALRKSAQEAAFQARFDKEQADQKKQVEASFRRDVSEFSQPIQAAENKFGPTPSSESARALARDFAGAPNYKRNPVDVSPIDPSQPSAPTEEFDGVFADPSSFVQSKDDVLAKRAALLAKVPAERAAIPQPVKVGVTKTDVGSAATDDATVAKYAEYLRRTNKMPPGVSPRNPELVARIHTAARKQDPNWKPADVEMAYAADKKSLAALSSRTDSVDAFSETAERNLVLAEQAAEKIDDLGSPAANKALRWAQQNITGDPNLTAFINARQTFVNETTKVLSGALGNAASTDSARHEVDAMFPLSMTGKQFAAAARTARAELKNRKGAYYDQLMAIRDRAEKIAKPSGVPGPAGALAPSATGPKEGDKTLSKSKRPMTFTNGQWVYDG